MKTPVFVTGIGDTVGKTLVTLGLVSDMMNNFDRVGFIKPLGIARVKAGVDAIDLDAMLIERTCALHENIKDMCPVTLSQTDWPEVSKADADKMLAKMKESFARVSEGRDIVVVEGTGGASLGSTLGLSNARVASELGCKAVLVAGYGVMTKNPFDLALQNADFFRAQGVETVGVIINRVPKEGLDAYESYARGMLDRLGLKLLGVLPEEPAFSTFRFLQVSEVLEGEFLFGGVSAENVIRRVRIGAMTPHRAIDYLTSDSLIITPGDREDMIVTICACAGRKSGGPAGLVLSGGQRPHPRIIDLIGNYDIPTFLAELDSYSIASKIHDMDLRIQPTDEEKISIAQQLVMGQVDLEAIVSAL